MEKRIWLTWEIQRRNRSMSSNLNADLFEIITHGPRWKRYPAQIFNTIKILSKNKSSVIFAQNPSIFLSTIVVLYGKVFRNTVVIDAHNAGVFPLEGQYKILNKIVRFINSLSSKVIVSNAALKQFINKDEEAIFAIPDPIPEVPRHGDYLVKKDKTNLVFICSWAADEPFEALFKIAKNLTDTTHIYITGNSKGKEKEIKGGVPENITLTGFLTNEKYDNLIHASDAIMVLTTRDNCLVCGAYEGVAVEKPMVLSETDVLTHHFNKGCVYTDNTSSSIESSIKQLIDNYSNLSLEIKTLKKELKTDMKSLLLNFNKKLSS